ncbi:MAG: hypothetical protein K5886_10280 [Lachnospiraceae bacterium]|nr:hypothetical protein [Lachnospiraceae bacterium]
MTVNQEIRKEQKEYMSRMTFKEKVVYLAGYYKWYVIGILAAIIFAVFIIRDVVNNSKPVYLNLIISNSDLIYDSGDSKLYDDFVEYADIDTGKYQLYIDTTLNFSGTDMATTDITSAEKIMALYAARQVDAFMAPVSVIDRYKKMSAFLDPHEVLSDEQIKELEAAGYKLYYCKYSETVDEEDLDPSVPEDKDVCIGIYVAESDYLNGLSVAGAFSVREDPPVFTFSTVAEEEGLSHAVQFLEMITGTKL